MPRIFQTHVPALLPPSGEVGVLIYGEAPGPRGADQSGIPFWGDRAGLPVYRALVTAGLAEVPERAWDQWDGATLKAMGLKPVLNGVGLGNAYPVCPTEDGHSFRAPRDKELLHPDNLARLQLEIGGASARCPGILRIIALGRRAEWILGRLEGIGELELCPMPHPSAQGLLQAAPGKGKGLKLQDLQSEWAGQLQHLLTRIRSNMSAL